MNSGTHDTQVSSSAAATADDAGITLSLDLPARMQADAAATRAPSVRVGDELLSAGSGRFRYAILGVAGEGGMATVHVARDLELMRKVALKQLSDQLRDAGPARLRFLREVQVTAQLDHPYIVPVYGLEVAPGGSPAYAMKLVEGRTLSDYLQETIDAYAGGAQPDEDHSLPARIEHLLKVCDAVDYAHGKGVIHRDLKPANIMLGPHGETYVMDWGICRLFGSDDPDVGPDTGLSDSTGGARTEFGSVVGTPRYMSPEQAQGRRDELGPASDQCALGLMLFELVTLRAPFAGANVLEVMQNAASARRAAVTHAFERRPVPAALRAIIERATRYEPAQRYASVKELADDLRRYLRGEAVYALPDSGWQRAQRFVGRHRQAVLLSLLGLIALAALGFTALMWRHEQISEAARAREALERDEIEYVVQQGDQLQQTLGALQNELESLALGATQLLLHGVPADDAGLYWQEDYLSAERRPPDFEMQPALGRVASMRSGVWSQAEGVDRASVEPAARRLHHLRSYRNELLAMTRTSLGGGQYSSGIVELRLVLEQGLFMHYPGHAVEHMFDLRNSSWYHDVRSGNTTRWGDPFLDEEGDNVVLPLSTPLRDTDGNFLGALSLELPLDFIVHNLRGNDDAHSLALLDAHGRILTSEDPRDSPARTNGSVTLLPFGDDALRDLMMADDVGAVATRAFEPARIAAFDRIHPQQWIVVSLSVDPEAD